MVQGPIQQERRPKFKPPAPPDWYPDWSGEICAIVASGPSAKGADLSIVRGRAKVIAINTSWKLAPWADVLYACDARWWTAHGGVPGFSGLKISQDPRVLTMNMGIELVRTQRRMDKLILNNPGVIGWGGNSGFHCLNLAIVWGCKKIILIGYDMTLDHGLHWHGPHEGMGNPTNGTVKRWIRALDGVAGECARLGVEVINTSPISMLVNYRKVPLDQALMALRSCGADAGARWGEQLELPMGAELSAL